MKPLLSILTAATLAAFFFGAHIDRHSNPVTHGYSMGALNPAVTQDNIDETICARGWTATIRPPKAYTDALKRSQIGPSAHMGDFEEDHLIPLELGGHPTDPRNLWAQPWQGHCGAHAKDREENRLHNLVCSRQMTLAVAQSSMLAWMQTCIVSPSPQ